MWEIPSWNMVDTSEKDAHTVYPTMITQTIEQWKAQYVVYSCYDGRYFQ